MLLDFAYLLYRIALGILKVLFLKSDLRQENLLLLKENQLLRRKFKKVKFNNYDRLFYMAIFRIIPNALSKAILVRPETIFKWHKKLVQKKWNYSNQVKAGRRKTKEELTKLIVEMKTINNRWGYRKIMGELKKIGIIISKTTIAKILKDNGFVPNNTRDMGWWDFIQSHGKRIWCCDFFTVETAFLQTFYVFVMIDVETRIIKHVSVTRSPCQTWLMNRLRLYFAFYDDPAPDILITDNDGIFGKWLGPFLKDYFNVKRFRTPIKSPLCNIYVERVIRTLRDELTDRMIFFGEKDLAKFLKEYVEYYNNDRSHYSLDFDAPKRKFEVSAIETQSKITKSRILDGLITTFSRAA